MAGIKDILSNTLNHLRNRYGEGILGVSPAGDINFVSPEFLSMTETSEVEVLNKKLTAFITADNLKKYFIEGFSLLSNGNLPWLAFECFWQLKEGKSILLSFTFYPLSQENNLSYGFVQKKLYPSAHPQIMLPPQVYLDQIMKNIKAVMWLASADSSQIYYMSPNFEKLYEISFEEVAADQTKLTNRIHPDDIEDFMKVYFLPKSYSIAEIGFRYHLNDGSWRHITAYRFFINDANGIPVKIVGIFVDDTTLYYAKEKLYEQQEILSYKNKELEKTNEMLEDFTTFACHDLSQPLRVFHTHTEILEKNYLQKLDKEGKQILSSIYSAIHRMQVLIKGMADLSLIENKPQKTPLVNVEKLLKQDILPLFINHLNPGCRIQAKSLHPLRVTKNHLVILLKNLIENGIKYNNNTPLIKIVSKKFKTGIVYTITDNGIGLPKEAYQQIFTLGRRLYSKVDQAGAGIGLSACKKIMSIYGGRIWVHSKLGEETTFYLFFPTI